MGKLHNFVNKYCKYLFDDYDFKIINAITSESIDVSTNILESGELILRIIMERGVVYFDFKGKFDKRDDWFDLDIVRSFIENPASYELDKSYSKIDNPYDLKLQNERTMKEVLYLKQNMSKIIDIFSQAKVENTKKALRKLITQRAKMFLG